LVNFPVTNHERGTGSVRADDGFEAVEKVRPLAEPLLVFVTQDAQRLVGDSYYPLRQFVEFGLSVEVLVHDAFQFRPRHDDPVADTAFGQIGFTAVRVANPFDPSARGRTASQNSFVMAG
jgi:hypothetical protein